MEINIIFSLIIFISSILGSMGLGGGSVLMLYFLFFSEIGQSQAQGLNLLFFIPTALFSIFLHKKNNLLDLKALKKILPSGILGCILGSIAAMKINPNFLKKVFAVYLLAMSLREFYTLWKEHKQKLPPKA